MWASPHQQLLLRLCAVTAAMHADSNAFCSCPAPTVKNASKILVVVEQPPVHCSTFPTARQTRMLCPFPAPTLEYIQYTVVEQPLQHCLNVLRPGVAGAQVHCRGVYLVKCHVARLQQQQQQQQQQQKGRHQQQERNQQQRQQWGRQLTTSAATHTMFQEEAIVSLARVTHSSFEQRGIAVCDAGKTKRLSIETCLPVRRTTVDLWDDARVID
eukprot:1159110-Pelagomonas_calceolata.AAC.3